jgi:hypothetical protein
MATKTLRPNAAGDLTQLVASTGSNYDCVNEAVESKADYVYTLTYHQDDLYNIDAFGVAVSAISSVKVYARVASIGGAGEIVQLKIKTGGIVYTSNEKYTGADSVYSTISYEWTTNPKTRTGWTADDIEALQIGLRLAYAYGLETRCSQIYVVITYTPITPSVPPTVTTQAVSDIESTTATGNGNITDTGEEEDGEKVTKRGVCYNLTGNPTVADSKVEEEGEFEAGAFTEDITGLSPNVTYYVKAYAYNYLGYVYGEEVNFTTDKVAPTVTVQAPTSILPTTATANGNITALGGENATVRGFEYGLTKIGTWDSHAHGSFSTGAFTASLTSLIANTSYWIRAYATNSIGTSYSEWIQFQTAAAGVIPTGTNLNICSDYSGYAYQLQRSETDDGDAYTAYFVISTDLTNKQGLAFYKRIHDLHLYFNGYDGGAVTVYVKRDSETTWQSVGSITLDDDEDIIVEHLACDIRAKHFLFKLSAANHFEFLGCLFEYIKDGMR